MPWNTARRGQRSNSIQLGLEPLEMRQLLSGPPLQVLSAAVAAGNQRSFIGGISVALNQPLTSTPTKDALVLRNDTTGAVLDLSAVDFAYDAATCTLQWTFSTLPGKTLPDGNYTGVLMADKLAGDGGPLDGNSDGKAGDNYLFSFFRLYGDKDGNRTIDVVDLAGLAKTYDRPPSDPQYDAAFDANGDVATDVVDLGIFARNYDLTLDPGIGLVLSKGDLTIFVGSMASFTVALASAPATPVTVAVTKDNASDSMAVSDGASLVFDASNWQLPQAVTLSSPAGDAAGVTTLSLSGAGIQTTTVTAQEQGPTPGASVLATPIVTSGGLVLCVQGTDAADAITITSASGGLGVSDGQSTQTCLGAFVRVDVYGFGGDDTIRVDHGVTLPGTVYGGTGNDQIFVASQGAWTLHGGTGDDLLVSVGGGNDSLAGDDGQDSFWCDSADTVADASPAELAAKTIHSITSFYQPWSTNPASPDYVPLDVAGQSLRDPALAAGASAYANFASTSLFTGPPRYNDIRQGNLGDCYFMSSLSSLAYMKPSLVSQMIAPLGDGTYAVRFYQGAQEVYLRVDADLPVTGGTSLAYAKAGYLGNELWVPLLEKAYAFANPANTYDSLNSGWMSGVLATLAGSLTTSRITTDDATSVFNYIQTQLTAGRAVTAASSLNATSPVIAAHAYMVYSVDTVGGMFVTVYNPWGYDGAGNDGNTSDGLVRLGINAFMTQFSAGLVVSLA